MQNQGHGEGLGRDGVGRCGSREAYDYIMVSKKMRSKRKNTGVKCIIVVHIDKMNFPQKVLIISGMVNYSEENNLQTLLR